MKSMLLSKFQNPRKGVDIFSTISISSCQHHLLATQIRFKKNMCTLLRHATSVAHPATACNRLFHACAKLTTTRVSNSCIRTSFTAAASSSTMLSSELPEPDHGNSDAGPGPGSEMLSGWAHKQLLEPGLYLVATPIGNLQDITLRALNVLKSASLILAEDTRHSGKLLAAYGIRTPMASYHTHNEKERSRQVVARLQGGEVLALVSDAGMPGISDPGFVLVQAAIEAGIRVFPVPGACAFVAAIVASGLPTDCFTFSGFLPPKQGARRARLTELKPVTSTLLFYAPPHGLRAVLADMVEVLGPSRRVCVARELTKVHEELFRSTLQEALQEFTRREPRGEICIVVQGCDPVATRYAELLEELQSGDPGGHVCAEAGAAVHHADAAAHDTAGDGILTGSRAAAGQVYLAGSTPEGIDAGAGTTADGSQTWTTSTPSSGVSGSAVLSGPQALEALLLKLLRSGMPTKAAAKEAARLIPGLGRKEAYAVALQLQGALTTQLPATQQGPL